MSAVRAVTRRSRWATHPANSPSAEARTRWLALCPARSRSLIAARSSASVLSRRRPVSCRWAATWAGLIWISCQSAGRTPVLVNG